MDIADDIVKGGWEKAICKQNVILGSSHPKRGTGYKPEWLVGLFHSGHSLSPVVKPSG